MKNCSLCNPWYAGRKTSQCDFCENTKQKSVYLCGPIDGVTPEWATEWRDKAFKGLCQQYIIQNPCWGKDLHAIGINDTIYTPKEIVETDLALIAEADILLVDWRSMFEGNYEILETPNEPLRVGTIMEIVYAKQLGKKVIVFGGLRKGYWLRFHADMMFDTLDDALGYMQAEGV